MNCGSITDVLDKIKKNEIKFISFQFVDILGNLKSVGTPTNPEDQLKDYIENGVPFDGSSVEGFVGIAESDLVLRPDIKTFKVMPWFFDNKKEGTMFCDVARPGGNPFEGDPRSILKGVVEECKKQLGVDFMVGPELEFFLIAPENGDGSTTKPIPADPRGYFDYAPFHESTRVINEAAFNLQKMGVKPEEIHHEVAEGQYEIDFKFANALTTADNVIIYKTVVKNVAIKHGLHATFMPKPIAGINGSGMHTHQSLFKDGINIFFDATKEHGLSDTALHFMAGQLEHARQMSAVLSPTVNSYKRLVPGYEAPVYICWARRNRSALIRIPGYFPGKEKAIRIELRPPDPSCNPYLAFAVILKAGLDGIRRKIEPPDPVEEDVYDFDDAKLKKYSIETLPGSLGEAIEESENSRLVRAALGEYAHSKLLNWQRREWDEYRLQVHEWEINRYLSV